MLSMQLHGRRRRPVNPCRGINCCESALYGGLNRVPGSATSSAPLHALAGPPFRAFAMHSVLLTRA
jgi:hypothetical protein